MSLEVRLPIDTITGETLREQLGSASLFEALVRDLTRRVEAEVSPAEQSVYRGSAALFYSPEACRLKEEIVEVGRKLWEREYVDGAGGNISVRLGSGHVLCTPTMRSKRDLTADDICMTDMDGKMVEGRLVRTSELLLHLAIYRGTSRARAVVHCHPPHATAWSLTESGPPPSFLVEQAIFVGRIPVARYETPGTAEFAETVLPFLQDHNSVLLPNHGIVCWADTVTHAEWLVEIVDTYCHTLSLAKLTGVPLRAIDPARMPDIAAAKHRIEALMSWREDAASPQACCAQRSDSQDSRRAEIETIVRSVLRAIADRLERP